MALFSSSKTKKTLPAAQLPGANLQMKSIGVKDIIAPSSIVFSSDYLKLGERFGKAFFIFSYPRYLTTGWFTPVINMEMPMDIAFHIHPIETGATLKQLRKN